MPRTPASRAPSAPSVEDSAVLVLFDLANHLFKGGERLARLAGLTTQQWLVLLDIAGDPNFPAPAGRRRDAAGGVLPSSIARDRGISRASVSAVVSQLLDRGLLRQAEDPADGRRRRLVVTDAGRRSLARVEPARRRSNQRLFSGLTPAGRRRLLADLRGCLETLWQDEAAPLSA